MMRLRWKVDPLTAGLVALWLLGLGAAAPLPAQLSADIANTKHNLSVSGPGPIKALTESRICVFCHTPHNSAPNAPLWNRDLEPMHYEVYTSSTLKAVPNQPSGPTKLCLSCHDGTIAMGAVLNPATGIPMGGDDLMPPESLTYLGLNLSSHHPVSFAYHDSLPSAELAASPPADLTFGAADEVHCVTCHDPHNDQYGKFLAKDNRYSALCVRCHQIVGWNTSKHATSTVWVDLALPRPPKSWPGYVEAREWGCEICHTPHFAPTAENLLNFTDLPPNPFSCTSEGCHSAIGAPLVTANVRAASGGGAGLRPDVVDIARQTRKPSAHRPSPRLAAIARRAPGGGARTGIRAVDCSDCHNAHLITDWKAEPPYVSGMLRQVPGVDRNGMERPAAAYEYEICFRCHGDDTPDLNRVPRVVSVTNTRRAFDTSNPSYHPVVGMGRNLAIPSIPSTFEPTMMPSIVIYCSTCHADDEGGARGPHGSAFAPILRERYETNDHTPESYDNYALCYRCHDRNSILSDASFRKDRTQRGGHSGHLAAGIPCSACHDSHGVAEPGSAGTSGTGDHTHLINFDTRIVQAKDGAKYPLFDDTGTFAGNCTLRCHGITHDGAAYQ